MVKNFSNFFVKNRKLEKIKFVAKIEFHESSSIDKIYKNKLSHFNKSIFSGFFMFKDILHHPEKKIPQANETKIPIE